MLGRGFTPTATAVTDTHKKYSDLGGSPRTFVFLPDTEDTPGTFNSNTFAQAINAGKAVGSRGPFVRVKVKNSAGEEITLGETIANHQEPVTAILEIQTPAWMEVNQIDVYMNLDAEHTLTEPGETITTEFPATQTVMVASTLEDTTIGSELYQRRVIHAEIELETTEDAYVVFVARGVKEMYPLVPGQTPFAFTNPIYIDADGGGYDHPPLADLAKTATPLQTRSF